MTVYGSQQRSALATLQRKGASVAFVSTLAGTLDLATELYSGATTSTVSGYAIEIEAEPSAYRAQELILVDPSTLLFASDPVGTAPPLEALVTWAGVEKRVRAVRPLQPDGSPIVVTVTVSA